MADHFSLIYSSLEDVPLILAPQFTYIQPVTLAPDFTLIDQTQVDKYVFELERRVTAEAEQRRHESETRAQLREEQLRAIREEKIRKQKEAARKIAPGFLDTDRRILTPVNARRRPSQQGDTIVAGGTENELNGKNAHGRASSNDETKKSSVLFNLDDFSWSSQSTTPNSQIPQSVQTTEDLSLFSETLLASSAPKQLQRSISTPANGINIQPNQTKNPFLPDTPTPSIAPVTLPPHATHHMSPVYASPIHVNGGRTFNVSSYAPIVPPKKPNDEESDDDAFTQLTKMGFSRDQATEALKKHENDIELATNYLLDLQLNS